MERCENDVCGLDKYKQVVQLHDKDKNSKEYPIFPVTYTHAVYDGKTGANLESMLAQFNNVFLQYQGTAKDTRLLLPKEMRRKGVQITYRNMDDEVVTEKCVNDSQSDNDHWGLDANWMRIDELSLQGDISVSKSGTWIINGADTGVKALGPKGDNGLTPWMKTIDNKLYYSYDNQTWELASDYIAAWFRFTGTSGSSQANNIGKIQISRDEGKTWVDLSGTFTNNLHIKGYVATTSDLPSSAVQGDIYGVGPTYAESDTEHTNPIYHLHVKDINGWVDNGQFTSVAAGVVQELGESETEVVSQKSVTEEINKLRVNVGIVTIPDFTIGKCVRRYYEDTTSLYIQTIANYISYTEGITKKYLYKKGIIVKLSNYNIAEFTLQYSYDGINWIEERRLREDFIIDADMYLFINIGYQDESKVVTSVEELLQYLSFYNPISNETLYLVQNKIVDSLTELTSDVESIPIEESKNLWTLGDLEYTRSTIIYLDNPIPVGTYTISAIVTSNNTIQEKSKIEIYQEHIVSSEHITNAILKHDGKRNNAVIELTSPAKAMVFYTGLNGETSPDDSVAKWVNILLEEGDTPNVYFENTTCVDYISRGNIDILKTELIEQTEKIALIEEKLDEGIATIEDLKDTIIYGGVFTEETKDNEKLVSIWVTPDVYERRPLIVVIDSKYTKEEGVTAYPYIQSVIQPEGYDYRSTKYKLGNEAKFRMQEVRMIPYPWGNTPCRVSIVVPAGITLEIRNLYSYYSDKIVRTTDGLRFNARTGSCNICPDETLSEMQMAYTLGYNTVIVIPKVSSDGVWFAYHDDIFDISSTILRNVDGSEISDTTYNGKYMHEIPWTYLNTLLVEPHKKTSPLRHETLMTIEEYLFFCANTGIKPMFSMHPVTGVQTQDNLNALKFLVSKYNLLDKLALKFPYVDAIDNLSNVFKVFGNDIYAYEIDSSTALTSNDFEYFNSIGITTKRVIEYEVKCFTGSDSEQLISTAKRMGWYVASYIVGSFTFGDVKSHSIFHGEDIRRLASMGVTEFTDDFNTSNGLNW